MPESLQPTKKALKEQLRKTQAALKAIDQPAKYPSLTKQCRYCKLTFKTPATFNGRNQEFCIPAHRKAFHKEGRKPIAAILKRQEKHMRQIAREEAEHAISQRFSEMLAMCQSLTSPIRTEPTPAGNPSSQQSV